MLNALPGSPTTATTRRILILADRVLPGEQANTGRHRRHQRLVRGLLGAGHTVIRLTAGKGEPPPARGGDRQGGLPGIRVNADDPAELAAALAQWQPEIIIAQGWPVTDQLDPGDRPLVIDLDQPLLEEVPLDPARVSQKLRCLGRADLVTCSDERLSHYFYSWLILAGFDLREPVLLLLPLASRGSPRVGIAPLDVFCRQPVRRQPRPLFLTPPPPGSEADPATAAPGLLVDQLEEVVRRAQGLAAGREAAARQRLASGRSLGLVRELAKRALGVNRRLVLTEHNARLAGDFVAGARHGQSFVRGEGCLDQIDILFATMGRPNTGRLRFHLAPVVGGQPGEDLVTLEIVTAQLLDNRYFAVVLPALPPAPGTELIFWLESPGATLRNSAAIWMTDTIAPPARQRFYNGRPVSGQLLFRLHERPEEESEWRR